MKVYCLSL